MLYVVLLLVALPDRYLVDTCDRIEVNHVYDGDGNLVFDQVIFWDWNQVECRWDVVDWRLLKDVRASVTDEQRFEWRRLGGPPPVGEWLGGHAFPKCRGDGYESEWFDGRDGVWRRIRAPIFLRTWTGYDREILERHRLPQGKRRRLYSPK